MNMKKVLAGAVASVMAVSSLAVFASAEVANGDEFTWELAGQLNVDFNPDVAEWPDGATGTGKVGEEITAVWEFDDDVQLATNYFGFKTVGVAWSNDEGAVNPTMDIISLKFDDREVAVDNDIFHANHTDSDGVAGNLKAVFYNIWDANIADNGSAFDVAEANGEDGFSKIEVVFRVNATSTDEANDDGEDNSSEDEEPADTDAPATDDTDKPSTNTGIEGVAVVAGLAVLATGAIVIAKKRK